MTLWGTWAEIVYGFTPLDIPMDIRDMTYYMNRLAKGAVTAENIGMTIFCGLSIFGIGEVFAHWGKIKKLLKLDGSDLRTAGRLSEAAGDIIESGTKTMDNVLEEVRDVAVSADKVVGNSDIGVIELSSSNIQHIKKHTFDGMAEQAKYLTDEQLINKLDNISFFNKDWSQDEIIKYTQEAYNTLRSQGKTGLQSIEINGEIIYVFIKEDGTFDTAYGTYKYTVEDFR